MAKIKKTEKQKTEMIHLVLGLLVIVAIIAVVVIKNGQPQDDNNAADPKPMSIIEAHNKCVVLELADLWLTDPDHSNIRQRAEKSCLLSWSTPELEKEFPDIIQVDWENHKNDIVDGQTLQELYNELFEKRY